MTHLHNTYNFVPAAGFVAHEDERILFAGVGNIGINGKPFGLLDYNLKNKSRPFKEKM